MIQDLGTRHLYNQYAHETLQPEDRVFCFSGEQILAGQTPDGRMDLPTAAQLEVRQAQYLFRIDDTRYFLADTDMQTAPEAFTLQSVRTLRNLKIRELAFAAATAYHLYAWYRDNRYCGRCGSALVHDEKLRMLRCPACGNQVFPRIAPAVIVAVTDGDRILLTQYRGRAYKSYALIAGFNEIGETAEDTVRREVMEEAGIRVSHITYYKSQPWGVDSNLLLGFFCRLDGDDRISMDAEELSTAAWFHREEIPVGDDGFSLTREMIDLFKKGGNPYV